MLPAVGAVIAGWRELAPEFRAVDQELLTFLARRVVDRWRRALAGGRPRVAWPEDAAARIAVLAHELGAELRAWDADSATAKVVNGTGILLHSGLGRAVLPPAARAALAQADGYVLLEVDRASGERYPRDAALAELLVHLTGAPAATVVNNNAAATLLILNTLAAGKDVLVSRSQMVEIGGSFRIPDVMTTSGCRLKEVGTTNRSYAADYERAIDGETGALLLVHTSNYRIVGFTHHVGIEELVEIGRRAHLPVIHDLGSGCLLPADVLGLGDEPLVQASVKAGADVICFSGDKMIGGAQAGIILGTQPWIERIRRNPLARAVRIDKLTAIALEAVLKLYLEPSRTCAEIPTLRMLTEPAEQVAARAQTLLDLLRARLGDRAEVQLAAGSSEMGSGALPAVPIATTWVTVKPTTDPRSCAELAQALRLRPIAIFCRLKDDRLWFDLRTLQAGEGELVATAFAELLAGGNRA